MTRDEALKCMKQPHGSGWTNFNEWLLDSLEALRLLHFEYQPDYIACDLDHSNLRPVYGKEMKPTPEPAKIVAKVLNKYFTFSLANHAIADECVVALHTAGYKIGEADPPNENQYLVDFHSNYRVCIKQGDNIVGIEGRIISLSPLDYHVMK